MKTKLIIYIAFLILLINIAMAQEKHYELELKYDYINDKVSLNHIYVVGGEIPEPVYRGDYKFELRSFANEVLAAFNFHMSANNNIVVIKVPYFKNGKIINIYDVSDNKLLDIDVGYFADVCGDNKCQDHENYASCEEDCPSGRKDNYCDKVSDGRCDPDCLTGDYDCEAGRLNVFFVFIGIAILLIIIILVLLRARPIKIQRKTYEDILELKDYITANLRRGYTKQQLTNELIKDGWPRKLIKKAFKTITKPKTIPKEEILELENYIMSTLNKGYSREQITHVLLKEGWSKATINKIFDKLKYSVFKRK